MSHCVFPQHTPPSSICELQLLSVLSQVSGAFGCIAALLSLQSVCSPPGQLEEPGFPHPSKSLSVQVGCGYDTCRFDAD